MNSPQCSPSGEPRVEPLALNKEQTKQALGGISDVTLWRLERRGLLPSVPGIRHKLYSVAAIKRFLEGKTGAPK